MHLAIAWLSVPKAACDSTFHPVCKGQWPYMLEGHIAWLQAPRMLQPSML